VVGSAFRLKEIKVVVRVGTYFPHKGDIQEKWYTVDAGGQVLGRVATRVASILRGKNREQFTPFLDLGDHVIVVNAAKIRITGNKLEQKFYRHYTCHPGALTETALRRMLEQKPERVIREAVIGMLPKNKLGKALAKKLLIYADDKHPHEAQKPEAVRLGKTN
jgi:large subunit ribosomal protein L13